MFGNFRMFFGLSKETFRPVKAQKNENRAKFSACTSTLLGRGNIREAVILPPDEDLNEWLAANTVDFFNELSLIWGIVCEEGLPNLDKGQGFPDGFEYRWSEGSRSKAPVSCTGPEYVSHVMQWVEGLIADETVFPSSSADQFPRNFQATVKQIFSRLFRIYAIVYSHHFRCMEHLGAVPHLNTSFKHFMFFCWEFDLLKDSEQDALREIIDEIKARYATTTAGGGSSAGGYGGGYGGGRETDTRYL